MKKVLLIVLPVALLLFSCSRKSLEINPDIFKSNPVDTQPVNQEDPVLSVSEAEIEINKTPEAFTYTLNVAVPEDSSWEVANVPDWLTVDPTQGTGRTKVTISADANESTDPRTAEIEITTSFDTFIVNVTQAGVPVNTISTDELTFDYDAADAQTVNITTEGTWAFSNIPAWVTIDPQSGSGDKTVSISVEGNTDVDVRSGIVDVNINGVDTTLTISQNGNAALDLTKDITLKQTGKYLKLSGTNDYMQIAYPGTSSPLFDIPAGSSYSVSMKIRIPNDPVTAGLPGYLFGPIGMNFKIAFFPGFGDGTQNVFGSFSGGMMYGSTSISLGDGKWHSLVMVIDNTTTAKMYLYIDGVKDAELPLNGTDIAANTALIIGSINDAGTPNHVKADIDDLHFWTTALTKKEVYADAANVKLAENQGDLVAAWDFESASGDAVKDTVGSIDGELKNGAALGSD